MHIWCRILLVYYCSVNRGKMIVRTSCVWISTHTAMNRNGTRSQNWVSWKDTPDVLHLPKISLWLHTGIFCDSLRAAYLCPSPWLTVVSFSGPSSLSQGVGISPMHLVWFGQGLGWMFFLLCSFPPTSLNMPSVNLMSSYDATPYPPVCSHPETPGSPVGSLRFHLPAHCPSLQHRCQRAWWLHMHIYDHSTIPTSHSLDLLFFSEEEATHSHGQNSNLPIINIYNVPITSILSSPSLIGSSCFLANFCPQLQLSCHPLDTAILCLTSLYSLSSPSWLHFPDHTPSIPWSIILIILLLNSFVNYFSFLWRLKIKILYRWIAEPPVVCMYTHFPQSIDSL